MVNKKGWLRIIEASIAVLIVTSVFLIISQNKQQITKKEPEFMGYILDEMAKQKSLRATILSYDLSVQGPIPENLRIFVSNRINSKIYDYALVICDANEVCHMKNYPENAGDEIYARERIITTNIYEEQYLPRKIKLFVWEKSNK